MNNIFRKKGDYLISTDKALLDFHWLHQALSRTYWSEDIPEETIRKAAGHSMTFGIYHHDKQVGYARIISDFTTFAYLADVYIDENHRKNGLSKWLMETITGHPELQGLRRWLLATADAHGLYSRFGFTPLSSPANFMEIARPGLYKKTDQNAD